MISKRELEQAIQECENAKVSYQTCEKLATFYTVYDHLCKGEPADIPQKFADVANGKSADEIWNILGELVDAVQAIHPKLYQNFIDKMAE